MCGVSFSFETGLPALRPNPLSYLRRLTVGAAERLGLAAAVHEVATNHVQTIFQKPRLIFEGALA